MSRILVSADAYDVVLNAGDTVGDHWRCLNIKFKCILLIDHTKERSVEQRERSNPKSAYYDIHISSKWFCK